MSAAMSEIVQLMQHEVPECRRQLQESHTNLEKVASYCEGNYLHATDKRHALEETKSYTTQSLASVAYQINTLATHFLQLLNLQVEQLGQMDSSINHLSQTVMIHKEKVARREIGVLTTNKTTSRMAGVKNPGIVFPDQPERPVKYVRKPIDFTQLDDIGHGVKVQQNNPQRRRTSSTPQAGANHPPTSHPPTPPSGPSHYKAPRESGYRMTGPPPVPPPMPPTAPDFVPAMESRQSIGSVNPVNVGGGGAPAVQRQMPTPPPMQEFDPRISNISGLSVEDLPPPPMTGDYPDYLDMPDDNIQPPSPGIFPPPLDPGEMGYFHQGPRPGESVYDPRLPEMPDDAVEAVPQDYLEKVVAIYDYAKDKEDELSFSEGQVIYVMKKNDDGWWEGVLGGETGLFPGNYVEPCI